MILTGVEPLAGEWAPHGAGRKREVLGGRVFWRRCPEGWSHGAMRRVLTQYQSRPPFGELRQVSTHTWLCGVCDTRVHDAACEM